MYEESDFRKAYYIRGVLDYVCAEYDEPLPNYLTDEMLSFLIECYGSRMCFPNAAGKFCEMFREVSK